MFSLIWNKYILLFVYSIRGNIDILVIDVTPQIIWINKEKRKNNSTGIVKHHIYSKQKCYWARNVVSNLEKG
jgi:hypothetical protein